MALVVVLLDIFLALAALEEVSLGKLSSPGVVSEAEVVEIIVALVEWEELFRVLVEAFITLFDVLHRRESLLVLH